ncbi:hypothetical protein FRX31_010253 [Thalictrum thalictroides]|uniref:Uncharacterized protein n=1 Tax=Thalictrum thalictroides TaxID=46969 RepID=A0A7J6WRZ2_THATH|nr:hypothetical protein FRX31_010253 [Thalictrum thalictroides]
MYGIDCCSTYAQNNAQNVGSIVTALPRIAGTGLGEKIWQVVHIAILWTFWKQRNDSRFRAVNPSST